MTDPITDIGKLAFGENLKIKEPTWQDYDFDKPSKAVIARGERDFSSVIWTVGGHVRLDLEETGIDADDMGLVPPDQGIWIWEGTTIWHSGTWECPQDGEVEFVGKFRKPTEEELRKIGNNECPWNDEEWKKKEEVKP